MSSPIWIVLMLSTQMMSYVSSFASPVLVTNRSHMRYGFSMNNKPPSNVDKMRLNYQKARAVASKSSRKEAKTQVSKVPEKSKLQPISRLLPTQDKPVFELFVKSSGSPWCRFKDVSGADQFIQALACGVRQGGIHAEMVREKIDAWVSIKIYGSSSFSVLGGEAETISNIKSLLPQFKKTRPRDMQFGYRILFYDHYGEPILLLDKTMINLAKGVDDDNSSHEIEFPERLDLRNVLGTWLRHDDDTDKYVHLEKVKTRSVGNSCEELINDWVQGLFARIQSTGSPRTLYIFCDGSATFMGNDCASASAGLIAFTPPKKEAQGGDYVEIEHASTLTITEGGGIIGTPYDAELIAGLVASIIASMIKKSCEQNELEISIFTDSRSLRRTMLNGVRRGRDKDENLSKEEENDEEENSSSALVMNRKLMTAMLDMNIRNSQGYSEQTGTKTNYEDEPSSQSAFNVHWINGHPERRESDRSAWNLYDMGIYLADEAARFPNVFTKNPCGPYCTGRFQISSVQHVECPLCEILTSTYNRRHINDSDGS